MFSPPISHCSYLDVSVCVIMDFSPIKVNGSPYDNLKFIGFYGKAYKYIILKVYDYNSILQCTINIDNQIQ